MSKLMHYAAETLVAQSGFARAPEAAIELQRNACGSCCFRFATGWERHVEPKNRRARGTREKRHAVAR